MTATVPTNEPLELRAGLTWEWRREDLSDYPASTWALKYWFKKTGSTGANFSITASADGSDFAVEVAAATTQSYTAGDYTWVAVVTSGADAFEVDAGRLKVLPRYDQAANLDDRSHARKVLEALEAMIEGKASLDQMSYMIGSRRVDRLAPDELLKWRSHYQAEVAREVNAERIANGLGTKNRVLVRF